MKNRIKSLIPLDMRTRLKWAGYALKDIIDPVTSPRVPPRRHTFIGGGDFEVVGDAWLRRLKRHGLTPDMCVLEPGCGQGRMARPLVDFLSPEGSYNGFDIVKHGIDWCFEHYSDRPNFTFIHADIYNKRYNPGGRHPADNYRFPFANNRFGLTFLTSVFTHMHAADVENYIAEIARTLEPGGTSLITWFLLNDISRQTQHDRFQFRHKVDAVSKTTIAKNPEAAIAFDENFVRGLYTKYGLEIIAIEYGTWGRPNSLYDLQDLVVARKV